MRVGVIGCLGSIGSRHSKNLAELGHEVLGYDPAISKLGPEDLLERSDAIVIASPTNTHADYLSDGLQYDKKLFVEKPIADTLDINFDSNLLMVGYNLRFHHCVLKAKEWIDAGFLGEPIWGNFVVAQYNNKYTDSVVLNWSHEIDLALHLVGPANLVNYAIKVDPVTMRQTMADLILFHSNGCQSTVHLDYLTKPEVRQTIIVGSEATVIMDLVNRHAWLRAPDGGMLDAFNADDSWDQNYLDEMETFIARVEGKETIGCTGSEGLEVLKICLAVKQLRSSRDEEKN